MYNNKYYIETLQLQRQGQKNEYGECTYSSEVIKARVFTKEYIVDDSQGRHIKQETYVITPCKVNVGDLIDGAVIGRMQEHKDIRGKYVYTTAWYK